MSRLLSLSALSLPLLLIAACSDEPEPSATEREDVATGSYVVDPETGATRASITNEDGTTTMRADTTSGGEGLTAELPPGFTLYPGAELRSSVEVGRGEGQAVMLTLVSEDPPDTMVAFYRKQAEAAGVPVEIQLATEGLSMIGGRGDNGTQFSFQASREAGETVGELTVGQLAVESGLN